jgi:hypothetical protein
MKKILALGTLVTVIALMASVSSATTTLEVWTTLVSATYDENNASNYYYDFGTTAVPISSTMPLGTYGVQVWAEILGGSMTGIASLAVTLYTPDTTGCFNPIPSPGSGNPGQGVPPAVIQDFSTALPTQYGNKIPGAVQYFSNTTLNPTNDLDSLQMTIGATTQPPNQQADGRFGYNTPVLIGTQAWNLTSLGTNGVTLGVYVSPTSAHWVGTSNTTAGFDSVVASPLVIPEPITMTMLGMGLSSLGMMIWRRRKETV